MSWKGYGDFHGRPREGQRRKNCFCGFHSARDRKKNLHHHGTRAKFSIRLAQLARMAVREAC